MLRIPLATYRLQFNAGFTFRDAQKITAYLADLGVSDVYASPILKARKGSTHGYDVVDATALNPELGTDADLDALHDELRRHELGFLLDVVPNHMAASPENAWWMSVLENGPHSRFLHYFDIDWRPVTAKGRTENRVLLPILGKPYGEAIESGEVSLHFDAEGFFFLYYDRRLPLAPHSYKEVLRECLAFVPEGSVANELHDLIGSDETVPNSRFLKETLWRLAEQHPEFRDALDQTIARFNGEAGNPDSFNPLDSLLDSQWYRLAYWRIASEKINYRRFFDVTDLVGVRVENPEVFEARNRRTFELIAEGKVTGIRIDHIDGLYDPIAHMTRMQGRLREAGLRAEGQGPGEKPEGTSEVSHTADVDRENESSASTSLGPQPLALGPGSQSFAPAFYILVEKILEPGEVLPPEFPVSGTTGYDFLDTLNSLFIDSAGLERLTRFYRELTGSRESFADVCYERKKQVINELFSGEMRALGKQLGELSMLDRNARDFAPVELLAALTEITACMQVYRTYLRPEHVSDEDRVFVREAIAEARRRAGTAIDERLFAFLERVLLVDPPSYIAGERDHWLAFVMRWQQFTGRVMAKGVEDTAFYNYNRLVSLNEVGGSPGRALPFDPVAEFHARNERMQRDWPDTMNASSTHDTKRSEDVRARINVLSEMPAQWEREVRRWSRMNEPLRKGTAPDPNEELLIYQTLVGMWPTDKSEEAGVTERLRQYLEKAAREAKTHTSWIAPDADYEKALLDYAAAIVGNETFLASLLRFQKRVAFYGFLNSLAQTVLKITSPGLPDFYQGTELWDFSLVDPDNRRPVDYDARRNALQRMKRAAAASDVNVDTATLLRRWKDGRVKLFVTWRALEARTRYAETFRRGAYQSLDAGSPHVVAFRRSDDIVVVTPRLLASLVEPGTLPLGDVWGERTLPVSGRWRNVFTGETIEGDALLLAKVFATMPVAILERT